MSYDVSLVNSPCEHCGRGDDPAFSWNYTTNMAPAWREAGADIAAFHGKPAAECAPVLRAAVWNMELHPECFARFNASNGWGSVKTLIPALRQLLAAMEKNPAARVNVWR